MPALLSQSQKMMATGALILSVLAIFVAVATQATPCAHAASGSCSVGDLETFTSAITVNTDLNDADTIISGDTETDLIHVDAGNDAVLIGASTPDSSEKLLVSGSGVYKGNLLVKTAAYAWIGTDSAATGFVDANTTVGVVANQAANDDDLFTAKSTGDVAHGLTTAGQASTETDTFFQISKASGGLGGVQLIGTMEDDAFTRPWSFWSQGGTASTTKTTAGVGLYTFFTREHNGANALADVTANGNIFAVVARVGAADVARWILDEDGDTWQFGSAGYLQSSDPTGTSNVAHVYSKDVAGTAEVFVRDEAGNVSQISPHIGDSWFFESCNDFSGKCVSIDMEAALAALETLTGQDLITTTFIEPKLNWEAEQSRIQAESVAAGSAWDAMPADQRTGLRPEAHSVEQTPQWLSDRLQEAGR